ENKNLRVGNQSPGEADKLSLAGTEVRTALLERCCITVLHTFDEIVCADSFSRRNDLFVGSGGTAVTDIVENSSGEEEGFLGDIGDISGKRVPGNTLDVVPV